MGFTVRRLFRSGGVRRARIRRRRRLTHRFGKSYWRKQSGINMRNVFPRPLRTLQPQTMKAVLRYALNDGDSHTITSTTGSIVDYVYRANDCYDPYAGGGGAQPRGFDQYMTLYRQFTVIGSRINVRFWYQDNTSPTGGTNETFKVGVVMNDASAALSSSSGICEAPHSNIKLLVGSIPPVRVSKGFSTKKYMQRGDPLNDPDLSGTAGASPADITYYHVIGYAMNSQTSTCYMDGWIDYIVVFHTPLEPAQSTI